EPLEVAQIKLGARRAGRCSSLSACSANRQLDHESCAFPSSLAACTNSAGVHFDDSFADRETEPQTFAPRIGPFEGSKNSSDKLWFDADAIIADLDGDCSWVRIVRPHRNCAVFRREFASVAKDVPKNLLQARWIGNQLVMRCQQGNGELEMSILNVAA